MPVEPGAACSLEVVAELRQVEAVQSLYGASYLISSPRAGEEVYGVMPVTGSVRYDSQHVEYYKLEIGRGLEPTEWLTLGDTHDAQVEDGVLEVLHADALQPGPYILRLVLVKNDGNYLEPPYAVPINVVAEPPPEG